jgi:Tol biopolymer transport system component
MRLPLSLLLSVAAANAVAAPAVPSDVSSARSDYNLSVRAAHRVFARSDADFAGARIYESTRTGEGWTEARQVAFSDPRWRDSDPWLTPDGRTLYFISDRPTPARPDKRDFDLWRAKRTPAGWSAPEHLGEAVNSPGQELGPELHGATLYFASSHTGGAGGLDLYAAPVDGDPAVVLPGAPRALPAPLNSPRSESDPTFSAEGRTIVFWRSVDARLLLHVADRDGEGWSTPRPLPDAANPGAMQITPSFVPGGATLVFASDAPREGQAAGLFDVYEVRWPLE